MIDVDSINEICSWAELLDLVETHSLLCEDRDSLLSVLRATEVDFGTAKDEGRRPQYKIVYSQAINDPTGNVQYGYLLYNRIDEINGTTIFIILEDGQVSGWRVVGEDATIVEDLHLH